MLIHSHNDYARRVPFYQAYAQQVSSIEADVFLHDGQLLVGHDPEEPNPALTFDYHVPVGDDTKIITPISTSNRSPRCSPATAVVPSPTPTGICN